jgi:hypothetical protein
MLGRPGNANAGGTPPSVRSALASLRNGPAPGDQPRKVTRTDLPG